MWLLWLATDNYDDVPGSDSRGTRDQGTKAPVPSAFKSPFVGKSLIDVVAWLRNKPEDVELETKFFAILDNKAEQAKVVLVRIADDWGRDTEPSCILYDAYTSTLRLGGIEPGEWDELLEAYGEYELDL